MPALKPTALHMVHRFPPEVGGTATRMLTTMTPDYTHIVFAPRPLDGSAADSKSHATAETFRVLRRPNAPGGVPIVKKMVRVATNALAVLSTIRRRSIEISLVHGHSPLPYGFMALVVAFFLRRRLIYELHTVPRELRYDNTDLAMKDRLARSLHRFVIRSASLVVVQFAPIKQLLIDTHSVGHESIRILPLAIDRALFHLPSRRGKSSDGTFDVLYVGSLEAVNGVNVFVSVVKRFAQDRHPGLRFVVAGRGSEAGLIESLAVSYPSLIDFRGPVEYGLMGRLYAEADLVFVPVSLVGRWEFNLPTRFYEAQVAGTPVLTADLPSFRDELGSLAVYFQPDDAADAAKKLQWCASHTTELSAMSQSYARQAAEVHDSHSIQSSLAGMYALARGAPQ